MLVMVSFTPATSWFQPHELACVRTDLQLAFGGSLDDLVGLESRSLIIRTMLFRLILMGPYWPLYSLVIVGGINPLATLST